MDTFLASSVRKSVSRKLTFIKSDFLTVAKSNYLDLNKFLDLAKLFNFLAVDRFQHYQHYLQPVNHEYTYLL